MRDFLRIVIRPAERIFSSIFTTSLNENEIRHPNRAYAWLSYRLQTTADLSRVSYSIIAFHWIESKRNFTSEHMRDLNEYSRFFFFVFNWNCVSLKSDARLMRMKFSKQKWNITLLVGSALGYMVRRQEASAAKNFTTIAEIRRVKRCADADNWNIWRAVFNEQNMPNPRYPLWSVRFYGKIVIFRFQSEEEQSRWWLRDYVHACSPQCTVRTNIYLWPFNNEFMEWKMTCRMRPWASRLRINPFSGRTKICFMILLHSLCWAWRSCRPCTKQSLPGLLKSLLMNFTREICLRKENVNEFEEWPLVNGSKIVSFFLFFCKFHFH